MDGGSEAPTRAPDEQVLQRGGRIEISLVKKGWIWSESYKPDENILSCTDGSTTDCVNGGFAVAYFEAFALEGWVLV